MAGRLRKSGPDGPGLRRQRCGRGWRYFAADGAPLRDRDEVARINGLAIPPAWQEVWICPFPNGHIQAVGTDAAGRRQYLYHERWRAARDEEKHDRVLRLAARLPAFRATVDDDLCAKGLTRERVLAGALRMLDRGVFRTGGDEYAEESRGVATLLRGDVRVQRGEIRFDYVAKGGVERKLRIRDDRLAALVTALRRGRADDERLLHHHDGEVHAADINERFQELTDGEFTAKDLRTWHATVLAAVLIAGHEPPTSDAARRRTEKAVMREVAEQLGNTPAVARRSYVDPRVLTAWANGRTISPSSVFRSLYADCNEYRDTQVSEKTKSDMGSAASRRAEGGPVDDLRAEVERALIRLLKRER